MHKAYKVSAIHGIRFDILSSDGDVIREQIAQAGHGWKGNGLPYGKYADLLFLAQMSVLRKSVENSGHETIQAALADLTHGPKILEHVQGLRRTIMVIIAELDSKKQGPQESEYLDRLESALLDAVTVANFYFRVFEIPFHMRDANHEADYLMAVACVHGCLLSGAFERTSPAWEALVALYILLLEFEVSTIPGNSA